MGNPWIGSAVFLIPHRLTEVTSWHRHIPFAFWITEAAEPRIFVELGTHKGDSYCAFCQVVDTKGYDTLCYAVDTWKGDEQAGFYEEDVYRELVAYHDERYGHFSRLLRSTFDDALAHFPQGSIDLLHLDGLHTYDAVSHDFYSWLPKLSPRGIVLLHDANVRQGTFGVWRLVREIKDIYPSFIFHHGHGLAVIGVGPDVPPRVQWLFNADPNQRTQIRRFFAAMGDRVAKLRQYNELKRTAEATHCRLADTNRRLATKVSRELQDSRTRLRRQDLLLSECDNMISRLSEQVHTLSAELATQRAQLQSYEDTFKQLLTDAEALRSALTDFKSQLALNQDVISRRDTELAEVRQLALERADPLQRLEHLLAQETYQRAQLQSLLRLRNERLAQLQRSFSWRITAPLRVLRSRCRLRPILDKAFPPGSRRRLTLTRLLRRSSRKDDVEPNGVTTYTPIKSSTNPEVSVLIVGFHKPELTIDCLKAIWNNTDGVDYEIVLVDNGSGRSEVEILKKFIRANARTRVTLVALGCNRGYGEANNIGIEHCEAEFVALLNNDTLVQKNWLQPLLHLARNHPNVGCVGATLLYPDGRLQEAGALLASDGHVVQRGKGENPAQRNYDEACNVDYCSAAALLIRKDLFLEVLGFDYRYDPGYYEDVDLCAKLRACGYDVIYCPESEVIHREGATSRDVALGLRLNDIVELNRHKFVEAWRQPRNPSSFRRDGQINIKGWSDSRRRTPLAHPSVGLFTPFNIIPGGGEKVLLTIGTAANRRGAAVHIVAPYRWSALRVASVARDLSIDQLSAEIALYSDVDLGSRRRLYDIFVAIGNNLVPPVDGAGKRNFYWCQFPFPSNDPSSMSAHRYHSYETWVVYSHFVKEHVVREAQRLGLPIPTTEVIYPPVTPIPWDGTRKRNIILNVGRFFVGGHNKKQLELVRAFRRLCDQGLVGWELHLAGSVHPEPEHREYFRLVLKEAEGYPITLHPNASPLELKGLFRQASIYWHATGFDCDPAAEPEKQEHFGITTVEAMSAGCIPVVVGTAGQREIIGNLPCGYVWTTIDQLISVTLHVVSQHDSEDVVKMRYAAIERAKDFTPDKFIDSVSKLFWR